MKLYHVTLNSNAAGIRASGLDPAKSMGKLKAVWYASEARLGWAVAHVCAKYNVSPQECSVFTVNIDYKRCKRTSLKGIYTCKSIVRPTRDPMNAAVLVSKDRE